jgi:hypothetical protein
MAKPVKGGAHRGPEGLQIVEVSVTVRAVENETVGEVGGEGRVVDDRDAVVPNLDETAHDGVASGSLGGTGGVDERAHAGSSWIGSAVRIGGNDPDLRAAIRTAGRPVECRGFPQDADVSERCGEGVVVFRPPAISGRWR